VEDFNCLFCYCPLHHLADCGGSYVILPNGWKDCTSCTRPHFEYDYIQSKLNEKPKTDFCLDS
jgi:Zn-finger protein